MEDNIIRSIRQRRRNPFLAFLLSLAVPGLGQLYNGQGLKGIVIALCTIVPLLLLPLPVIAGDGGSVVPLAVLFAIGIAVRLYACLDAPAIAFLRKTLIPGRSNTPVAYVSFTLLNLGVSAACVSIVLVMFTIVRAPDARMAPTVSSGDYVLVNRYRAPMPGRGDVVLVGKDGSAFIARVIGQQGDVVAHAMGTFRINGRWLSTGIITDEERGRLKIANSEYLFYETDGKVKYPVRIRPDRISPVAARMAPVIPVEKDRLLVAYDNREGDRPFQLASVKEVSGVLVGIIKGSEPRRVLSPLVINK